MSETKGEKCKGQVKNALLLTHKEEKWKRKPRREDWKLYFLLLNRFVLNKFTRVRVG
jgi:hypothetical protein